MRIYTDSFTAHFFHREGHKLHNEYPDVPITSGETLIRSMDSIQGLTTKVPSVMTSTYALTRNFLCPWSSVTRRTIDQSAGGKLRDQNAKESWVLLKDPALYDNESWNDPRDFAKPVKEIAFPQDVSMNKVTTSCEIYSGPHDTQYCMEDLEQAFVEYASSRTDEAVEGLVSNFMASQDTRLSKFEADFKQQQSEMTNKIDTVLKAITDRIAGALPSDMVKNPKMNASPVLSARSYPSMARNAQTMSKV
ncbi:hypothetical protein Tco_0169479 [Tanacetum coccineum]